jgi:hypothetical protein
VLPTTTSPIQFQDTNKACPISRDLDAKNPVLFGIHGRYIRFAKGLAESPCVRTYHMNVPLTLLSISCCPGVGSEQEGIAGSMLVDKPVFIPISMLLLLTWPYPCSHWFFPLSLSLHSVPVQNLVTVALR